MKNKGQTKVTTEQVLAAIGRYKLMRVLSLLMHSQCQPQLSHVISRFLKRMGL